MSACGAPIKAIEINDARLHYFECGEGEPLVFVHGGLGSLHTFQVQVQPFAARFRVITAAGSLRPTPHHLSTAELVRCKPVARLNRTPAMNGFGNVVPARSMPWYWRMKVRIDETHRHGSGRLRLEAIAAAPPVRPGTAASLAAMQVAGRWCIALARDPLAIDAVSGKHLLQLYAQSLFDVVGHKPAAAEWEIVDGLTEAAA